MMSAPVETRRKYVRYYCPVKGGMELNYQFMQEHKCLRKQRKGKNKRTKKREFFRCPRLIVVRS